MDAKKKAELIETKIYLAIGGIYDNEIKMDSFIRQKEIAKKCSLIAIDEILEEIQPKNPNDYCSPITKSRAEYWVLVKNEIQKL